MKRKSIVFLVLLIAIASLFIGCDQQVPIQEQGGAGILRIGFNSSIARSTLVPEISMKAESYSISGVGPEGRSFTPVTSGGEDVTISDLYKGDWTITVVGLNAEATAIGEGNAVVTIIPETTVSTNIRVVEYAGEGTFSLEVNWPDSDIADPQILAMLTPTTGESTTPTTLGFEIDKTLGKATYSGDFPAGYYVFEVKLYDGSSGDINNKLYGTSKAVRIVKGNTTSGTVILTKDNLNVYGNLTVSVEDGLPVPFDVAITPSSRTLRADGTAEFTAEPDVTGTYAYSWYMDGELQRATGDALAISGTLPLGNHVVDVIASRNGILASASATLQFQDSAENYISVRIMDPDTDEIVYEFLLEYGIDNYYELMYEVTTVAEIGSVSATQLVFSNPDIEDFVTIFGLSNNKPVVFSEGPPADTSVVMIEFKVGDGEFDSSTSNPFMIGFITTDNSLDYELIEFSAYGDEEYHIIISNYEDVGGMIEGTVIFDSIPLYGANEEIGDYKVEIEFKAKRAENIYVNNLSFDGNRGSGEPPQSEDNFKNVVLELPGNYEYNASLEKAGKTFIGWNTKANGTGTFYGEGDSFTMPDDDVVLYAVWEDPFVAYKGESGGYVFYDKGYESNGWQYLEAAPSDIVIGTDETHICGYYRNSPTDENLRVGTKASIGAGLTNTEALVEAMSDSAYISYDSSVTDTTTNYAAKLCSNYVVDEYSDWFLPSKAELNQMYQNLKMKDLGGFSDAYYWSSSEELHWYGVWNQSFSDGSQYSGGGWPDRARVRAIRAF